MGQGTHKGHSSEVYRRIDEAREHYETRAERRPRQVFVCANLGTGLCHHVWVKR